MAAESVLKPLRKGDERIGDAVGLPRGSTGSRLIWVKNKTRLFCPDKGITGKVGLGEMNED